MGLPDSKAENFDAHSTEVGWGHIPNELSEHISIPVHLLHCQATCKWEDRWTVYVACPSVKGIMGMRIWNEFEQLKLEIKLEQLVQLECTHLGYIASDPQAYLKEWI